MNKHNEPCNCEACKFRSVELRRDEKATRKYHRKVAKEAKRIRKFGLGV